MEYAKILHVLRSQTLLDVIEALPRANPESHTKSLTKTLNQEAGQEHRRFSAPEREIDMCVRPGLLLVRQFQLLGSAGASDILRRSPKRRFASCSANVQALEKGGLGVWGFVHTCESPCKTSRDVLINQPGLAPRYSEGLGHASGTL